ncbi:MAG: hypothetical protein JWM10_3630 [Myxococcaceae bacterium]|nr:hypothetical protein [Myxococcaceae bacterium]
MARPSLGSSWWVLSAITLAAAVLGVCLADTVAVAVGVALPASALCSLAALWASARRAKAALRLDPGAAFVHALVTSSIAIFVAFGIVLVHAYPTWVHRARYDEDRLVFGEIFVVPLLLMVVLPLAVGVAEALIARSQHRLRAVVRVSVGPLAALVTALAVVGGVRHLARPEPTRSFDRFPVVATVDHAGSEESTTDHPVGDLTLTVACVSYQCPVILRRSSQGAPPVAWSPRPGQYPSVRPGDPLRVRRDARHDLWIVQSPRDARYSRPIAAFRGPALARVDLSLTDFSGDFAPPLGWSVAALLGVALAAWFVRRARSVEAPPPGLADATLGPDGVLHLADGTTLSTTSHESFSPGPVVVDAPPLGGASYRDRATARIVRAGTLARWTASLRDERDVRLALAFSTLVLLGTPMMMAAYLRLLG